LASESALVLCCTDPAARMAPTRGQTAAAGVFDAQAAVERLEAEMTEIRGDITELKQSAAGIANIQQNMVTMDALDALMQKYLSTPSTSATTDDQPVLRDGISHQPSLHDQRQFPPLSVTIPLSTNMWSNAAPIQPTVTSNMTQLHTSLAPSHVTTDSVRCATTQHQGNPYNQ